MIDLAYHHDPDLATFSHHHFEDIAWSDPDERVRAVQSLFDEKGALRLAECQRKLAAAGAVRQAFWEGISHW